MNESQTNFTGRFVGGSVPVMQPEGFCLLTYQVTELKNVAGSNIVDLGEPRFKERIWNSRDGVTPHLIGTPNNSAGMTHVDEDDDEFAPYHVPDVGTRVFVDQSLDRAIQARHDTMVYWCPDRDSEAALIEQYGSTDQACVELGWADWMGFWPHTPCLMVVNEHLRDFFKRRGEALTEAKNMMHR